MKIIFRFSQLSPIKICFSVSVGPAERADPQLVRPAPGQVCRALRIHSARLRQLPAILCYPQSEIQQVRPMTF